MSMQYPPSRSRIEDLQSTAASQLAAPSTTSGVLGAAVDTAFKGDGSFGQDIDAYIIGRETGVSPDGFFSSMFAEAGGAWQRLRSGEPNERRGTPLSKDEWESSEHYRHGLEYVPNMTDIAAQVLARRKDRENYEQLVLSNASTSQAIGFYATAIGSSLADPKGIVAGGVVGTGLRLGATGIGAASAAIRSGALTTAGRATMSGQKALGTYALEAASANAAYGARSGLAYVNGKASFVALEAGLASAPIAYAALETSSITQSDYGIEDAGIDLAASVILSLGFHAAGRGISRLWDRHATPMERKAVADALTSQMENGEIINIRAMTAAQMSGKVIPISTLSPNELSSATVVKTKGGYEAFYAGERGLFAGVVSKGKTEAEALQQLEGMYAAPNLNEILGHNFPPEYGQMLAAYKSTSDRLSTFDSDAEFASYAESRGVDIGSIDKLIAQRKTLRDELDAAKVEGSKDKAKIKSMQRQIDAIDDEVLTFTKAHKDAIDASANDVKFQKTRLEETEKFLRSSIVDIQEKSIHPEFQSWLSGQVREGSGRTNAADPLINGVAPDSDKLKAQQAPKSPEIMLAKATEERASLDLAAINDKSLANALGEVDNIRDNAARARAYLDCIGGR
jgi:hypothetical protein